MAYPFTGSDLPPVLRFEDFKYRLLTSRVQFSVVRPDLLHYTYRMVKLLSFIGVKSLRLPIFKHLESP